MRRTAPLLVCAATVCALALAGCTNGKDEPPATSAADSASVTPAPLPTIPEANDPQTIHEQEAIDAYEAYVAVINAYYKNGDWTDEGKEAAGYNIGLDRTSTTPIYPTGPSDGSFGAMLRSQPGVHQEGDIVVREAKVIDYQPGGNLTDSGGTGGEAFDQAFLEVCYDASDAKYVSGDGTVLATGHPAFVATVTMESAPASNSYESAYFWIVADQTADWERPC